MKALIVTQEHQLVRQDIPMPEAGEYEALVSIKACGICSTTDRELIKGIQPFNKDYPAVLGHEAVGEVVETGSRVTSFAVGNMVTRPVAIWPGECRDGVFSAWGGFAEYGIIRDWRAMQEEGDEKAAGDYTAIRQMVVPQGLDLQAAVLTISLAETAGWFHYLPNVAGKSVCVAGTGIVGLSLAIWSKLAGADPVIVLGRRQVRLDLAREVAADDAFNVTAGDIATLVKDATDGGVDIFIEGVGHPDEINIGLSLIRPGGLVAVYGVTPGQKHNLGWSHGPTWANIAQYPADDHRAHRWTTDMLQRGYIPTSKLITHSWPLHDYQKAFAAIEAREVVKGMLVM